MEKFKPGDAVQMKSGGPQMTVKSTNDGEVCCHWFKDGKLETAIFPETSLIFYHLTPPMIV